MRSGARTTLCAALVGIDCEISHVARAFTVAGATTPPVDIRKLFLVNAPISRFHQRLVDADAPVLACVCVLLSQRAQTHWFLALREIRQRFTTTMVATDSDASSDHALVTPKADLH
jgi:hypothetical protein